MLRKGNTNFGLTLYYDFLATKKQLDYLTPDSTDKKENYLVEFYAEKTRTYFSSVSFRKPPV